MNGGSGNDTYGMTFSAEGNTFDNEIIDAEGDADKVQFDGFTQGLNVDLLNGTRQPIAPGASINFDFRFGPSIENASFQPVGDQPYNINGTAGDNTFGVVPVQVAFGDPGSTPIVTIGDGLAGNDTFARDTAPLPTFNPFFAEDAAFPGSFADPDDYTTYIYDNAPGSGDVIDLGPTASVTVAFADALRAVDVDLDLQEVDQVVDVNGNTMRFESPIRNFIGSQFDDTLLINATVEPRSAVGGDGTDAIAIDAGGRAVTQTVDGETTIVEVAGYSPIVVTEFENITIANAGPAGGLAFDLSPDTPNALLQLEAVVGDDTTTLGRFTLSSATDAFAEEAFLHKDSVTEIRSTGGTLTIDALGQPVEHVGDDVLIAGLPAIRPVGFTDVIIENIAVEKALNPSPCDSHPGFSDRSFAGNAQVQIDDDGVSVTANDANIGLSVVSDERGVLAQGIGATLINGSSDAFLLTEAEILSGDLVLESLLGGVCIVDVVIKGAGQINTGAGTDVVRISNASFAGWRSADCNR